MTRTVKLYRGQAVNRHIGLWWSDRELDAEKQAAPYGSANVILMFEVESSKIQQLLVSDEKPGKRGNYYRIPHDELARLTLAVQVISGRIRVTGATHGTHS